MRATRIQLLLEQEKSLEELFLHPLQASSLGGYESGRISHVSMFFPTEPDVLMYLRLPSDVNKAGSASSQNAIATGKPDMEASGTTS